MLWADSISTDARPHSRSCSIRSGCSRLDTTGRSPTDPTEYTSRNDVEQRKKLPRNPRKSQLKWASLWPPNAFVAAPGSRDSLMWTNWPLFTVGLVQRGYKDEEIQKILGLNSLRVTRDALAK